MDFQYDFHGNRIGDPLGADYWNQFTPTALIELVYKRLALYDRYDVCKMARELASLTFGDEENRQFIDEYEGASSIYTTSELQDVVDDIMGDMHAGELVEFLKDRGWLDECAKDFIKESYDKFYDWPDTSKMFYPTIKDQLAFQFKEV